MDRMRQITRLRPPAAFCLTGAAGFSAASLWTVATPAGRRLAPALRIALDSLAMLFLALAVWALVRLFRTGSPRRRVEAVVHRHPVLARLWDDARLRAFWTGYGALAASGALALSRTAAGWRFSSGWDGALAGYYLVLCAIRGLVLHAGRTASALPDLAARLRREWIAFRRCGWLLMVLALALQGVVVQIVRQDSGFSYEGSWIFAAALYDFSSLTLSLVRVLRSRRQHTPALRALGYVSLAVSLVSMLALQTAMFQAFGQAMPLPVRRTMNLATGTAVCALLAGLGLWMTLHARRALRPSKDGTPIQ